MLRAFAVVQEGQQKGQGHLQAKGSAVVTRRSSAPAVAARRARASGSGCTEGQAPTAEPTMASAGCRVSRTRPWGCCHLCLTPSIPEGDGDAIACST